jgi:hypothetical protein
MICLEVGVKCMYPHDLLPLSPVSPEAISLPVQYMR